jgi:hypothetical protein
MQIAILIGALILGAFVLTRLLLNITSSYRADSKLNRRADFASSNPFSAVSIQPAENLCSAVEPLKAQRFLSEHAPELPLPGCTAMDCGCKYIHHADRRGGGRDRRSGVLEDSVESEFWSLRNRRLLGGRRQGDIQVAA